MNPREKLYKDYRKRKWSYLIATLTILTTIVFAISFGIFKTEPKWYIFIIMFFIGKGITNFLLNRHYTVDKTLDFVLSNKGNKTEVKVSNIKQNNNGTNYVQLIIDFEVEGKILTLEGYIIDDCISSELIQIIEHQTTITDIEDIIESGKKTMSYYLEDFSFDIDFEKPMDDKSDLEKGFHEIDKIMNNPKNN